MFFKSFLLFIAVISVLIKKPISATESQMTDVEEDDNALKSSFVSVHINGSFACIGYIYSVNFQRVFTYCSSFSQVKLINEKNYRENIFVKSKSDGSEVKDLLHYEGFWAIFLIKKLEGKFEVGFDPVEILDKKKEIKIENCKIVKWDKEREVFVILRFEIDCTARGKTIDAELPRQSVFVVDQSKRDHTAILLEKNNVIAFCQYVSCDRGTADFLCINYKNEREGLIKLEKKKQKMGFCGLFRKKEKKTSSALQTTK